MMRDSKKNRKKKKLKKLFLKKAATLENGEKRGVTK